MAGFQSRTGIIILVVYLCVPAIRCVMADEIENERFARDVASPNGRTVLRRSVHQGRSAQESELGRLDTAGSDNPEERSGGRVSGGSGRDFLTTAIYREAWKRSQGSCRPRNNSVNCSRASQMCKAMNHPDCDVYYPRWDLENSNTCAVKVECSHSDDNSTMCFANKNAFPEPRYGNVELDNVLFRFEINLYATDVQLYSGRHDRYGHGAAATLMNLINEYKSQNLTRYNIRSTFQCQPACTFTPED